jgi:hypothetical protein
MPSVLQNVALPHVHRNVCNLEHCSVPSCYLATAVEARCNAAFDYLQYLTLRAPHQYLSIDTAITYPDPLSSCDSSPMVGPLDLVRIV